MAALPIVIGPDNPILRKKSAKISSINNTLRKLLKDMEHTMQKANGIGIAAPQVGANVRACLCFFNHGTTEAVVVPMVNPKMSERSAKELVQEEGCLSVPGVFGDVARAYSVTVTFLDPKGKEQRLKLEGMNARIVQHELDHLDGTLCVDKFIKK